ncbi:unnamed protein product [Diatraea saccharalis]|uniref:Uncharacterized protein n=1 Tax=Diatraea saccharalis TaxID=40085 RepID=A0A9N9R427_9NEOP|nr:unnamed protein product [Diatraea saccharalis]
MDQRSKTKRIKGETIKKSILQNVPYVNYKGNLCQPKPYGMDCRCRAKCIPVQVSEEVWDEIYKKFTSFITKNEQDTYLQCLMTLQPVSRKRTRNSNTSKLPNIPVQDIFYYRQLSLSLFNVHSLGSGKSRLYLYHQGIARKSPDEVTSFISDYIHEVIPPQVKHLHIFADACGGQNRNNTLVRLCLALVATKRF